MCRPPLRSSAANLEESPPAAPRSGFQHTFSALQYPNYRLWFAGQLVSLVGTWMQSTAQGFLVYELTHSPEYLGYVGFAAGIPTWLFTLYGGVVADRMPRRNLLIITQTVMMFLAAILAALTFSRLIQPWHIIILAFMLGTANAFDAPARQSFVFELVERKDLTNAIALNATMFNLATAAGPSVAGVTYALLGPAWCFTINAVSFVAVIIALGLMRLKPWAARQSASALRDVVTGVKYVVSEPVIAVIILGMGVLSLLGMGFVTLFPAWAVEVLHGDATTNGLLQSARGVGAVVGALLIASSGSYLARGKLLTAGLFLFPSLLFFFSWSANLPTSLGLLAGIGLAFMLIANLSNSLVQTRVPDELRGRVMGIYTLSFFGLFPIGALIAGQAAGFFGEQITVRMSALLMFSYTLLIFAFVPRLRRLK